MKRLILILLCWLALVCQAHATIDIYVDTDATGAEDGTSWTDAYTSLADAEAENLDLTTEADNCVIHCRASSGTADTTAVTIAGWTISDTYDLTIQCDPDDRHNGTWDMDRYRLETNGQWIVPLVVQVSDVTIQYLQIDQAYTASDGSGTTIIYSSACSAASVIGCICRRTGSTGDGNGIYCESMPDNSDYYFVNNLFYDFKFGISDNQLYSSKNRSGAIYNNTIIDCTTLGMFVQVGSGCGDDLYIYNNLVQGCGSDYLVANITTATNISEDTSSPDTAYRSISITFSDAANDNYSLASTDTDAIDSGTDLSSDSTYPVSTDIIGTSRPQNSVYDIGAFEYESASTPAPASFHIIFF